MKNILVYAIFIILFSGCNYKYESYSESYTSKIIRNVALDIECVKASLEQNSEFDPVTKSENSLSTSSSDINVQVNMTENELIIVSKYKTETKQDKNIYIVSALGKRLERSIMKDCGY
ncbi:hypothetical protein [Vibrio nereis]|uniref:Lipoprotein n=1 Tax=Vibrio nereis TaxID=693 RepID=A0A0M0HQE7_VIBNE|nr:hypothetical protein [Vibrio nereis]KOO04266.1 hypothetical protein AKJ17_04990 [Vibrio nereis]